MIVINDLIRKLLIMTIRIFSSLFRYSFIQAIFRNWASVLFSQNQFRIIISHFYYLI